MKGPKIHFLCLAIIALVSFALCCCGKEVSPRPFENDYPEEGVLLDVQDGTAYLRWAETPSASGYKVYCSESTFGEFLQITPEQIADRHYETDTHCYWTYRVTACVSGEEREVGTVCAFGKETLVVSPDDDMARVQTYLDERHSRLESASEGQFSSERLAVFLLPGKYDLEIKIGYYTSVSGLGKTPADVRVKSLYVSDGVLANGNSTCTFWRSAENFTVTESVVWGVSQATSLRRMRFEGNLKLSHDGWSSGGFLADSEIMGTVDAGTQQQWMSRNDEWRNWQHCDSHNYVFSGCIGNIPVGAWSENGKRATVLETTEKMAEKPYLYCENGEYRVFVPAVRENSAGVSWRDERGYSVSLDEFYVAGARDSAESLNAALEQGKHLFFPAGVYPLGSPLDVTFGDTVLLGSGYATLKIADENKDCALKIADVSGVRVGDLLIDAGKYSKNMAVVGEADSSATKSAPIVLSNLYLRVGGVENAHTETDTALVIHADDVLGDNFWIWRADHSQGVEWEDTVYEDEHGVWTSYGNPVKTGILVTGDRVACYGLMVEHCEGYQTLWEGEDGLTVMYQSETPYRVPAQEKWMSGEKNGCASYKVADGVARHRAFGVGIYLVNYSGVNLASAIEVPEKAGIEMCHLVVCAFTQNESSVSNVINGYGGGVNEHSFRRLVEKYPLDSSLAR